MNYIFVVQVFLLQFRLRATKVFLSKAHVDFLSIQKISDLSLTLVLISFLKELLKIFVICLISLIDALISEKPAGKTVAVSQSDNRFFPYSSRFNVSAKFICF